MQTSIKTTLKWHFIVTNLSNPLKAITILIKKIKQATYLTNNLQVWLELFLNALQQWNGQVSQAAQWMDASQMTTFVKTIATSILSFILFQLFNCLWQSKKYYHAARCVTVNEYYIMCCTMASLPRYGDSQFTDLEILMDSCWDIVQNDWKPTLLCIIMPDACTYEFNHLSSRNYCEEVSESVQRNMPLDTLQYRSS